MDSPWTELPLFKAALMKKGLQPKEFERTLHSKITKIFENEGEVEDKSVGKSVQRVRKNVCIRENESKPGLDQRYKVALNKYVDYKILPDAQTPPKELIKISGGRQGNDRYKKTLGDNYHKMQNELFSNDNLLGREFRELNPPIKLNESGLFIRDDDTPFSIEDACRVIDKFTCMFLQYFIRSKNKDQVPFGEWEPQNLSDIQSCCELIISGRMSLDWGIENNLLENGGYNTWKSHVMIVMSYAALAVVLDMIVKKKKRRKKKPVVKRRTSCCCAMC